MFSILLDGKSGAVCKNLCKNDGVLLVPIVGSGPNVIQSISRYFTDGRADPSKTNTLAVAVAEFLDQVNTDADVITACEKGVPPPPAPPAPPPGALSKIKGSVGRWETRLRTKNRVTKPCARHCRLNPKCEFRLSEALRDFPRN
jgi:hypothetical protein